MSDPRHMPANGRVAHVSLEGQVAAARFVEGEPCRITVPVADLLRAPNGGQRDKQMLAGWAFTVLERRDGWAFGFDTVDGYVGYLREATLGRDFRTNHRVRTRATHVYKAPDFKSPDIASLSFLSELEVIGAEGAFRAIDGGGYVPAQHLAPLSWVADDPVAIAELLLGTPYLWGGNSAFGIDCSGLVQLAFWAAGRPCPRDSDMQMEVGENVVGPLQRGDLVFWKGHVALVASESTLLHANIHNMAVACEGIDEAIARIAAQGEGPVIARRRLA